MASKSTVASGKTVPSNSGKGRRRRASTSAGLAEALGQSISNAGDTLAAALAGRAAASAGQAAADPAASQHAAAMRALELSSKRQATLTDLQERLEKAKKALKDNTDVEDRLLYASIVKRLRKDIAALVEEEIVSETMQPGVTVA
jgi:hypothetical protein